MGTLCHNPFPEKYIVGEGFFCPFVRSGKIWKGEGKNPFILS